MPVPAGPRRAAPPRKKPAKSLSPVPQTLDDEIRESPEKLPEEDRELKDSVKAEEPVDERKDVGVTESEEDSTDVVEDDITEEPSEAIGPETLENVKDSVEGSSEPSAQITEVEREHDVYVTETPKTGTSVDEAPATGAIAAASPTAVVPSSPTEDDPVLSEEPVPEPEDEDETLRRKRVAERLAKMGAFNPLASAPARRQSSSEENPERKSSMGLDSPRSPPLPPQKRLSLRKGSADDGMVALGRRSSVKDTDVDSTTPSYPALAVKSAASPPTSPKPETPTRKTSIVSTISGHIPVGEDGGDVEESQDGKY
jgi:hypothetical protein